MIKLKNILLLLLFSAVFSTSSLAQEHAVAPHEESSHEVDHAAKSEDDNFDMAGMIMHHILDSHEWEFTEGVTWYLPVIVYTKEHGLDMFSSKRFHEGNGVYGPYEMHHDKISLKDDHHAQVYDLSITKNVASLLISCILLLIIFTVVAKGYITNKGKAPTGVQAFFEPIITVIKDDVVKPNIGPKYEKFLPYMLTLFFFILINNLMGLTPGAANLTGNITITLFLALITFVLVQINGKKNYWMHIVLPPGVPKWLLPLFWIIEVISVFVKPASLTIRLFANITGGHIVILSLIGLIFMFKSMGVGVGVTVLGTFMTLVEILVAFIQSYIFVMLSCMYIGSAMEEEHH